MQYALPAGLFIGVLFFFWGISTLLSPSGSSVEERMARYAGGQPTPTEVKPGEKKKKRSSGRKDLVDPFATLSGDAADKKFSTKVQRDLARANLKLRVSEYYYIRVGTALGLGLTLGLLRDPLSGLVGAILSGTSCRASGSAGGSVAACRLVQQAAPRHDHAALELASRRLELPPVDRARVARGPGADERGDGPRRA